MNFQCAIAQGFGGNANPLYAGQGLKGHTGIDESCGWGTDIKSYVNGKCYSTYPIDKPASDGYTAIFIIVKTPLETLEFSYGHVSRIDVKPGDPISVGEVVGAEGNHGEVYYNGQLITLAMQAAGDHRGAHRHVQCRVVTPVPQTRVGHPVLTSAQGQYRDSSGNYLEVVDYNNGYNGCVDFTLPLFNNILLPGMNSYNVVLLQKALINLGYLSSNYATGFFGTLTMDALLKFQKDVGLSPFPIVGPGTRSALNARFSRLGITI